MSNFLDIFCLDEILEQQKNGKTKFRFSFESKKLSLLQFCILYRNELSGSIKCGEFLD